MEKRRELLERRKKYSQKWREENPEKVKESNRIYKEENKERIAKYNRLWRDRNPKKVKEVWEKRVKRKRQEEISLRLSNNCMICGFNRAIERCHIVPKSKGGKKWIWLCPNHHTLFDNNKLTIEEIEKINPILFE